MVRSRGKGKPGAATGDDGGDERMPTTPIFINGLAPSPVERRRSAKLFHKKSRTGCQRCRARRVKCDEVKPICSHCARLGLGCVYDRTAKPPAPQSQSQSDQGDASSSRQGESSSPGNASITPSDPDPADRLISSGDPPESESRRKLEVELFYQYTSETGPSIPVDEISRPLWMEVICSLAFKSDAVLYSVYLLAALHRAKKSNFTNEDYVTHCHTYLNLALREHHKDLAQLSARNLDYICLASNILRIYGFIRLQDRPLKQPYEPPVDWLQITGTSNAVFRQAPKIAEEHPETAASVGMRMIGMVNHILAEDAARAHSNEFLHLLRREEPHELAEPWDDEVEDAYRATVNYVAGIWKALDPQDAPRSIGRRLVVFPMLLNNRFVTLLEERRPRALVILAHYFALLDKLRSFWWIGDLGAREVRAIVEALPPEWQGLLTFPLHIINGYGIISPGGRTLGVG